MKINLRQKKVIHTLKGALKLDDDTYRAVLAGYGVASSVELSYSLAEKLIDDLAAKAQAVGVWEKRRKGQTRTLADDDQSRKIRALWLELHQEGKVRDPSEKALAGYLYRMEKVSALQFCSAEVKRSFTEKLKKWLAREDKI